MARVQHRLGHRNVAHLRSPAFWQQGRYSAASIAIRLRSEHSRQQKPWPHLHMHRSAEQGLRRSGPNAAGSDGRQLRLPLLPFRRSPSWVRSLLKFQTQPWRRPTVNRGCAVHQTAGTDVQCPDRVGSGLASWLARSIILVLTKRNDIPYKRNMVPIHYKAR